MIDDGEWAGVPDRRPRHGEHRAHVPRRRRALASRRRAPPVRAGRRRRLRAVRRPRRTGPRRPRCWRVRPPTPPARLGLGPAGRWRAPITRSSRVRWQTFEPDVVGVRLVGEQLSPVIAGDLERSALPVGVFEWWVENPSSRAGHGRAPGELRRPSRWTRPRSPARSSTRPPLRRRIDRWRGVRRPGRSRTDGPARHAWPSPHRPTTAGTYRRPPPSIPSRTPTSGTTSPPMAALTRRRRPGRSPNGRAGRCRDRGDRRSSHRANAGRSGSPWPGTCRWSSSEPVGAGGSGTRATGVGPAAGPGTLPSTPSTETPSWRGGHRGLAGDRSWTIRTGRRGTGRRSSTSSTSSSTAARSGRRVRSAVRSPALTTSGVSRCSSASTTPSTTRSTWTSTRPSRCSSCSRTWSCAGSATCSRRSRSTTRRSSASQASGRDAPRKLAGTVPHDVGGPGDDPFHRPNWYRFQDVNGWKDLGPKFVLQAWRDAVAAGPDGRGPDPRGLPDRRCGAATARGRPTATATASPSTMASPTRPTTRGRCTARPPTAARSGSRRTAAAERDGRMPRGWRGRAPLGGLVRAGAGRLRPAALAGRLLRVRRRWRRRARRASWPTSSPASGTRM